MQATIRSLKKVFREPRYTVLALGVAFTQLSVVLWWQNWSLVQTVVTLSEPSLLMKLSFLVSLYAGLGTNFTLLSAAVLLGTVLLFGMQIALLTYFIRRSVRGQRKLSALHGFGVSGLIASTLGIGCAACGSLMLTSLIATAGGAVLVTALPLHGLEFGIVGLMLLGYATILLARKIDAPNVCEA
jgi:hypothetical protein